MFGMIMFICSSSKIWIASSMRNAKNLCRIRLLHCIDYKLRKDSIFAKHGELMKLKLIMFTVLFFFKLMFTVLE